MGPDSTLHHAALAEPIETARADLVFLCGVNMKALWEALPPSRKGAYAGSSRELVAPLLGALQEGDAILVKGSNGSRLSVIIDALKALGSA
jgi:UDP-N-acetylmuramoyl-tripeptide--D-alanyl-D-alanine ligase